MVLWFSLGGLQRGPTSSVSSVEDVKAGEEEWRTWIII